MSHALGVDVTDVCGIFGGSEMVMRVGWPSMTKGCSECPRVAVNVSLSAGSN